MHVSPFTHPASVVDRILYAHIDSDRARQTLIAFHDNPYGISCHCDLASELLGYFFPTVSYCVIRLDDRRLGPCPAAIRVQWPSEDDQQYFKSGSRRGYVTSSNRISDDSFPLPPRMF